MAIADAGTFAWGGSGHADEDWRRAQTPHHRADPIDLQDPDLSVALLLSSPLLTKLGGILGMLPVRELKYTTRRGE